MICHLIAGALYERLDEVDSPIGTEQFKSLYTNRHRVKFRVATSWRLFPSRHAWEVGVLTHTMLHAPSPRRTRAPRVLALASVMPPLDGSQARQSAGLRRGDHTRGEVSTIPFTGERGRHVDGLLRPKY